LELLQTAITLPTCQLSNLSTLDYPTFSPGDK